MKLTRLVVLSLFSVFLFSCVSQKKYKNAQALAQAKYDSLNGIYAKLQGDHPRWIVGLCFYHLPCHHLCLNRNIRAYYRS